MKTFQTLLRRSLQLARQQAGALNSPAGAALRDPTAVIRQALESAGLPMGAPLQPGTGARTRAGATRAAAPDAPAAQELLAGQHTEAAGTRQYRLYVPGPPARQPWPLLVMLHGCTQTALDFAAGTRMTEFAARQGFAVLYPEQAQDHNPQRCWNWFKHNHQARGKGEPAILAGMVRAVTAAHGVDPRRVYVAGLSAGGAMAAILGDAYPDVFAAVGVHSGLPSGAASDVSSAFAAMQGQGGSAAAASPAATTSPPTIVFHGDQDSTVHPVNGEHVLARGAQGDVIEQLQGRHDTQGRAYTRQVHRDAQGRSVAEHWVVHGAGHAWSGGSAQGSYTDPLGPDASAEMLRFFSGHSLPAASAAG